MFEMIKKLMFARQISFEEGKITLLGEQVVISPLDTFIFLSDYLRKEMGLKADKVIYAAAKDTGVKYTNAVKKHFSMSKVDMVKWAVNSITLSGWGIVRVMNVDATNNRVVIRVTTPIITKEYRKMCESTDMILAGFFAGGISAVFEKNVDVEQVKCMAKGDPFCEFIVAQVTP